ncbi:hypothetical protein N9N03_00045 [Chlamydiia bacterium]|nr:hypothetical protein [Chlamydiia bacterium]
MPGSIDFFTQTPIWVYAIFFYLVFLGVKSSHSSYVNISKLMIVPSVFSGFSLYNVALNAMPLSEVVAWVLSICLGGFFGAWRVWYAGVRYDVKKQQVYLTGSWVPMVVFMLIFVSKYVFGFVKATNTELYNNSLFHLGYTTVSGLCVGQFVGVLVYCWYLRYEAKGFLY